MQINVPAKLRFLYEPARYKVIYGGRGSGKSWGVADALLIKGIQEPKLILCAREFQSSIADSVHALLSQQIELLNLGGFYDIQQACIKGKNGTQFIFAGLRHNVNKIKSTEGVDIAWVEEANTTSKASLETLIPTVRKANSELWFTFNPELETDEVYKRFVLDPSDNTKVVKMNWTDNPYFPEVLQQEKEDLKRRNYDDYLNVWEGYCKQTVEGAVYATEMRNATLQGRICRVPAVPGKPIETFWDLGKHDNTSVWFVQLLQGEYRVIDFYQNRGEDPGFYLKMLQERGYLYGTHYLPHDAAHDRMGMLSIERQFKAVYPDKVKVVERTPDMAQGISMMRSVFPLCWFDEEKCADGLNALRRYKYKVDPNSGNYSTQPLHDENSDAADAIRQLAQMLSKNKPKEKIKTIEVPKSGMPMSGTWLGR